MAANSILIEQARRFTLLVGNYSREGFNHPGPAFLYVESWDESIFWALLHVVPTAWNGQLVALYPLNAGFASCVVAVVYGWTGSLRGVLAAGAVLALFGFLHPAVFNSGWMPYVYVPAFLSAVFALPLILQVAITGPANFEAYLAYQSSGSAGGHTLAEVTGYVLWFWWPHANAWAAPLILALTAGLLLFAPAPGWRLPPGPARRFCCSLLLFDALSVVAVTGYVVVGVDSINQYYICYFSWANPVVLLLVSVIAAAELIASAGRGRALAVTAAAALAAWWVFAAAPATQLTTVYVDPENPRAGYSTDAMLPAGVAAMGDLAAGRAIVLTFPHNAWPTVTGILVQAERTGVRACVADRHWKFMQTSQFICAPAQVTGGYPMSVYPAGDQPRGVTAVARFQGAIAVAGGQNALNRYR
jgi:hypothetical protein